MTKTKNEIYDEETIEVMRRVLQPTSICIDVGAHQGSILRGMIRIAPDATHFAIEPLPDLAQKLQANFPGVIVYECALSDRNGEAEFQHVTNDRAYSGLLRRAYDRPDPIIEKIFVKVRRLDDLIPKDATISFIKIDIEGGEYHAMKGATKIIKSSKPTIVFEAGVKSSGHYGVNQDMIYDFFKSMEYCVSTMARWLNSEPPFSKAEFWDNWESDYYFIAYSAQ